MGQTRRNRSKVGWQVIQSDVGAILNHTPRLQLVMAYQAHPNSNYMFMSENCNVFTHVFLFSFFYFNYGVGLTLSKWPLNKQQVSGNNPLHQFYISINKRTLVINKYTYFQMLTNFHMKCCNHFVNKKNINCLKNGALHTSNLYQGMIHYEQNWFNLLCHSSIAKGANSTKLTKSYGPGT